MIFQEKILARNITVRASEDGSVSWDWDGSKPSSLALAVPSYAKWESMLTKKNPPAKAGPKGPTENQKTAVTALSLEDLGKNLKPGKQKSTYEALMLLPDEQRNYLVPLAKRESGFIPDVRNEYGYTGLFQLGEQALEELKRFGMAPENMTLNRLRYTAAEDQARLALNLAELNWRRIVNEASQKLGQSVNGIPVTKPGLLAAAHLVGPSAVKKWLASDGKKTKADANGTKIEDYMRLYM
jgi:hypothetical protein